MEQKLHLGIALRKVHNSHYGTLPNHVNTRQDVVCSVTPTYYGIWSDHSGSYKWQDIAIACEYLDAPDNGFHQALSYVTNTG